MPAVSWDVISNPSQIRVRGQSVWGDCFAGIEQDPTLETTSFVCHATAEAGWPSARLDPCREFECDGNLDGIVSQWLWQ